ncbi:hypothetical protein ACFL2L_01615, partial [Patescibacteria group bacterium]
RYPDFKINEVFNTPNLDIFAKTTDRILKNIDGDLLLKDLPCEDPLLFEVAGKWQSFHPKKPFNIVDNAIQNPIEIEDLIKDRKNLHTIKNLALSATEIISSFF